MGDAGLPMQGSDNLMIAIAAYAWLFSFICLILLASRKRELD